MRRKPAIVAALGAVAGVTCLAAVLIPLLRYRLREAELIETIAAPRSHVLSAREEAARELGAMRSARAIPHLIQLWDAPLLKTEEFTVLGRLEKISSVDASAKREHAAAREALALIGKPAIPLLLERFRKSPGDDVVLAIRAIGEAESVKEVSGWTTKPARPRATRRTFPPGS